MIEEIGRRIAAVRARIASTAAAAGRDPASITLVAITKTVEVARIRAAVDRGLLDLGESTAQAIAAKRDAVPGARWHFVGPMQRNKAKMLAGSVVLIHSVDSPSLAVAIGRAAVARDTAQDVLLEVNTSGEASKHGVAPDAAAAAVAAVAQIAGIRLRGLMTVARPGPAEVARADFRLLRRLRDTLARGHPDLTELSMGMSGDFDVAVQEGATFVRVGSAIFGDRPERAGRK